MEERNEIINEIKKNRWSLRDKYKDLNDDLDLIKELIKNDVYVIQLASERIKNNKEIILEVVKKNGFTLEFASDNLKADKDIVIESIKNDGRGFQFASNELRADKELFMMAFEFDPLAVGFTSEAFKDNFEILLNAVKRSGGALEHASERLKENREIVLAAVKKSGFALFNASNKLKGDKEIVMTAVKEGGGYVFEYAATNLKNDVQFISELCEIDSTVIKFVTKKIRKELSAKKKVAKRYTYPEEGVNQSFELNKDYWDRGFYEETEEGIWYNVFVNEATKEGIPTIKKLEKIFLEKSAKFYELDISMYEEYSQINFFVPNNESKLTLDEMTEIIA